MVTHFKVNDIPRTNLARLVFVVMCLPESNAPIERVFSQINDIWTAARNRFAVPPIKAMLIMKTNFNLPCEEFMEKLVEDRAILKKILLRNIHIRLVQVYYVLTNLIIIFLYYVVKYFTYAIASVFSILLMFSSVLILPRLPGLLLVCLLVLSLCCSVSIW